MADAAHDTVVTARARRPSPRAVWGPSVRPFVPRQNREPAVLSKNPDESLTKRCVSCVDCAASLCAEPTGARSVVRPGPAGPASPWGPVEGSRAVAMASVEHAVPSCCWYHWVFKMGIKHARYQRNVPVTPSPRFLFAGSFAFAGLIQGAVFTGRSSCPLPGHKPHVTRARSLHDPPVHIGGVSPCVLKRGPSEHTVVTHPPPSTPGF